METTMIKLLKITQLGAKAIYVGKMSFTQLQSKVSLTKRTVSGDDEYQRESDTSRINKITEFLKKHDKAVSPFPTPLVLALSTEQSILISSETATDTKAMLLADYLKEDDPFPILINNKGNSDIDASTNDFFELHIPENTLQKIFIVDGQHRFRGVKKYFDENTDAEDLEFAITFLLDYDIYEQAEVFANINFKQKPVNKSLYYDIFGSLPGRNEFTFTHYLVKTVNQKPPLDGLVKMLGKGSGIVSLAFMVETIQKQVLGHKGQIYNIYREYEELDLLENELNQLQKEIEKKSDEHKNSRITVLKQKIASTKEYKRLPELLTWYLTYFHDRFEKYFPRKVEHPKYDEAIFSSYHYEYYMFKATGMFGVLKIFNDLFEAGTITINDSQGSLCKSLDDVMRLVLENQSFFFEDTRLLGAGSASLQGKFYKMLHSAIFDNELNEHK